MTMKTGEWISAAHYPRFVYFMEKHNLRWTETPTKIRDDWWCETEGAVEDVMAVAAEMQSFIDSEKKFDDELIATRPFFRKVQDAFKECMGIQ